MHEYFFSNPIFHMWETVLIEWENCNILDKIGDVPIHPPAPIGNLAFGCLSNLKEKQLKKLV
jgi:hypothetical protein